MSPVSMSPVSRTVAAGRGPGRFGRVGLLALCVAVLQGCGVPAGSSVHTIDPVDIPSAFSTHPGSGTAPLLANGPEVYYADADGRLVPEPARVSATGTASTLQAVLTQLAAGPSTEQNGQGLTTELPPSIALHVDSVSDHQATLALSGDQLPPTDQTTAIAQIVLSATSVDGVTEVLLTLSGRALEAPLADGALTTRPLTAADYRTLIRSRPST